MSEKRDYRDTVFLPATGFPMKAGLAAKEPAILARWESGKLYQRLREARAGRARFILHDGPPYANGDLHMGHAMNKILKDIIVRSQSLTGKDAPYIPGWDCHGLPIEWKIEEQYRAKKRDKDDVPAAEFRAECRAYAAHWVGVQREQFKRLGVMGDWDDPYLTMKFGSEASIVAELLKFAETGQLYRGAKPVMWSPVEKTALAEAEVEYEDVVSTQIDVGFEIVESPIPELVGAHAVVWTTTPWTIPVNQAIAYGPEVEYSLVELDVAIVGERAPGSTHDTTEGLSDPVLSSLMGRKVLVASDLLEKLADRIYASSALRLSSIGQAGDIDFEEHWRGKGSELAGTIASHPIHAYLRHSGESGNPASSSPAEQKAKLDPRFRGGDEEWRRALEFYARPRPFLPGDFVTTDQGTGLVHMAPDHGEDDFLLCKAHGIDPVFAVEGDGKYRADWAWLGGQGSVINKKFNAPDGPICADLRAAGALLAASEDFAHSYPHSWRSKAKVIFRATPQWFIPMDRSADSERPGDVRSAETGERSEPWPISSPLVGEDQGGGPAASAAEKTLSTVGEDRIFSAADAAGPHPGPPHKGEGVSSQAGGANNATLRAIALDAIARIRWVPPRSENRITAMVDSRPDWVISRQRAWGVPIALYANRDGEYLRDPAVNARIVAAFEAGGADAWFTADHAALLGPAHSLDDWTPVTDILDVWFDSGSTHAFVIEQRYGPDVRADLYIEGSDQHRGWFQSSLLESCGTRGRAPYAAVLTHGFALDESGRKMAKSLGNVVDPLKIIDQSGADILRLWVASTDYFEDVRIGKEILSGASDAYRKLRNTFRYLLGALSDFDEAERVPVAEMPELERYMLHLLARLDAELREHVANFAFNPYMRALTAFAQDDLSAFFFDIRKDSLYCDAPSSPKRRAYRTVLDTLFHALVRYAAPVLCFTAEEVWETRFPDAGSIHLREWPEVDPCWIDSGLAQRWGAMRAVRSIVNASLEEARREGAIKSSLEADVQITLDSGNHERTLGMDWSELLIVSSAYVTSSKIMERDQLAVGGSAHVLRASYAKCGRCWRLLPEVPEDGALCARCASVVG
ncbi:MAG: isoleucine--tRNA ligase [Sphingomonadaceae bacterium]|nr:isoleucine--tRNA ligase [Sphingomonadaceae bacterium]